MRHSFYRNNGKRCSTTSVPQFLFIISRLMRYIHTAVSFLITGVKRPGEDYWEKLNIVLKLLKGTKHMKLT